MPTVYLLWHVRPAFHEHGDEEDAKLLGVFSSEQTAKDWQDDARVLPGFRDFPDDFVIDPYELDQRKWSGGFETLMLPE